MNKHQSSLYIINCKILTTRNDNEADIRKILLVVRGYICPVTCYYGHDSMGGMVRNKYNAVKTVIDDIKFDSKKEAARYCELKLLVRSGQISELVLQVRYNFFLNNINIAFYKADFCYLDHKTGETIVEDVKGYKTAIYRLKKKMMKAFYNIEIKEI